MPRLPSAALGLVVLATIAAAPAAATSPSGTSGATTPSWPPTDWRSPLERPHPLAGQVYDVAANRLIPAAEAFARLVATPYVLAGERHDNADHHGLQAAILDALTAAGRRPAVVFEQIDDEVAPALDAWEKEGSKDAAALGPALRWEDRGWPAWSMYQPIAEAALAADLPLVAGNIGRATVKALAYEGWDALPEALRAALGVDGALPTPVAAEHRRAVVAGHCGMIPESAADPMVRVQAAKDSVMADALRTAARAADGAVLIAGNGHTRKDVGVPFQLRRLAPGAVMVTVAAMEVQPDETDPAAYGAPFGTDAPPFDYVFFTPAADQDDPCAKYADQLKKAGARLKTQGKDD